MLRVLLSVVPALVLGTGPLVSLPEEVLEKVTPAQSNPSGAQCSDQNLLHCQSQFNTNLGIAATLDWHKPYYFHYALQNIYQTNGTQGLINVCSAYGAFTRCLGTQYAACINPLFFLQHGYGLTNSYVYPGILAGLHFQCGGGLETILGSWNCIRNQLSVSNSTIQGCIISYHTQMAANPAMGCTYGQQLITCVRAPFKANCNAPSSWYECEYTRVGIAGHLPYCDPNAFRCYVGQTALGDGAQGAPEDHPSLKYADKGVAFQAALKAMAQSKAGKLYDDLARLAKVPQPQ